MTKKVIGGVYRFKGSADDYDWASIKEGDLCVLINDDDTRTPKFYNPNWNGCVWINIDAELEFVGVFE